MAALSNNGQEGTSPRVPALNSSFGYVGSLDREYGAGSIEERACSRAAGRIDMTVPCDAPKDGAAFGENDGRRAPWRIGYVPRIDRRH